jgi:hypothetical protein
MNAKWKNDRDDVQNLVQAITDKCIECSCFQLSEVEQCFDTDCPLYPYRVDGRTGKARITFLQAKRNLPPKNANEIEGKNASEK